MKKKTYYYIVEQKDEFEELKSWKKVLLFLVGAPALLFLAWLIFIIIL